MVAIDTEMPKSCIEVTTRSDEVVYNYCPFYNICTHRETIKSNFKPSDCPLKEIVTCKDCKHWIKNRYCYKHTPQVITYESDFCNYGERRE
jgi:hypothetical protein